MRVKFLRACLPALAIVAVASCNKPETLNNSAIDNSQATVSSANAKPKPRYQGEEKGVYLYVAALSDDDKKAGKTSGDVVQYRYLGEDGGLLKLQQEDASGNPVATITCTRECHFLTAAETGGSPTRLAFDKDTLVGSAMTDAINGYLMPSVVGDPQSEAANKSGMEKFDNAGFSDQEKSLVAQAENLSGKCRDGGDTCDESEAMMAKLKKMHICYGPYSAIEADKNWMRCTPADDREPTG